MRGRADNPDLDRFKQSVATAGHLARPAAFETRQIDLETVFAGPRGSSATTVAQILNSVERLKAALYRRAILNQIEPSPQIGKNWPRKICLDRFGYCKGGDVGSAESCASDEFILAGIPLRCRERRKHSIHQDFLRLSCI